MATVKLLTWDVYRSGMTLFKQLADETYQDREHLPAYTIWKLPPSSVPAGYDSAYQLYKRVSGVQDEPVGAVIGIRGSAGAGVIFCYVVGATPFAAGWLSLEPSGEPLIPSEDFLYLILSEGDYLNNFVKWDATANEYQLVASGGSSGASAVFSYIVGSTPLASNWLSKTPSGDPLDPEDGLLYLVLTPGDYLNSIYRYDESAHSYVLVISGLASQVHSMPTAAAGEVGKVYQYLGADSVNFKHGKFYECVENTSVTPHTYSWQNIQVDDLSDYSKAMSALPSPSVDHLLEIVQYTGTTTASLQNGFFYQCVADPDHAGSYIWVEKQVSRGKDNVIDGYYDSTNDKFYRDAAKTQEIAGEADTLYQDRATNFLFRFDGTHFLVMNDRTVILSQAEYDALPTATKNNGIEYFVYDAASYSAPFTSGYVPVGTIISVLGTEAPKFYQACDGSVLSIADYPELSDYFEDQFGSKNYFGGDGITTFAVPDLTDRFLKQSEHPGTLEEAGLPNLYGKGGSFFKGGQESSYASPANSPLYSTKDANRQYSTNGTSTNSWASLWFDASRSNSIYGNSTTVTPANLQVLFCIATKNIKIELSDDFDDQFSPIGMVISFMGIHAPSGYLPCDGETYLIADYPKLAEFFENEFGTKNHFGGDGTSTFAVPDLQGEFLRGTGTNSYANSGSGSAVGVHQEPTAHLRIDPSNNNDVNLVRGITDTNYDTRYGSGKYMYTGRGGYSTSTKAAYYTSRPTNTSVLYCIKAESSKSYQPSEQVVDVEELVDEDADLIV